MTLNSWLSHPIVGRAGSDVCRMLARRYPLIELKSNASLAKTGRRPDGVTLIFAGAVRVFHRTAEGKEVTVALMLAPGVVGDIEALGDAAAVADVVADGSVLAARIPCDSYKRLVSSEAQVMAATGRHMARLQLFQQERVRQHFAPLESRIATLLLCLGRAFGSTAAGCWRIDRPFGQRDIAQALGASRRSVNRIVARWAHQGIVAQSADRIEILAGEVLERLAGSEQSNLCYSLLGSVSSANVRQTPRAQLTVVRSGATEAPRRYTVTEHLVIGRAHDAGLVLQDTGVSLRHCRVYRSRRDPRFWVEDLGSTNGTWVGGRRLRRRRILHDDARITVGPFALVFRSCSGQGASQTTRC